MRRIFLGLALVTLVGLPAIAQDAPRARLRDLGIVIGHLPTGRYNAITDVAGVRVGHTTLSKGSGKLVPGVGPVRTGVTAVIPRDDIWHHKCFANVFVLNGNGEMTGAHWVNEAGWLETPILLTDTLSVGRVDDAVVSWMIRKYPEIGIRDDVPLPVVAECDDEFLNDQQGRHVQPQDVFHALDTASSGPVPEGGVGAGTGMVCYRFKGGIGTSSRVIPKEAGGYTVGVLVNANMGARGDLRLDGVPVGEHIPTLMPIRKPSEGSIIIVVGTDAPLRPDQLQRLAKRAALGLARTGATSRESSGDYILAFSTATEVPHYPKALTMPLVAMNNTHLDPLFDATIEATEESIGNALTMAKTTVGRDGDTAFALPLAQLKALMRQYGR